MLFASNKVEFRLKSLVFSIEFLPTLESTSANINRSGGKVYVHLEADQEYYVVKLYRDTGLGPSTTNIVNTYQAEPRLFEANT